MRPTRLFPRAGQPLDLSRNYYLREDGTFSEIPVQVIPLLGPPAPPYVPTHSTRSAPLYSAASLSPRQSSARMTNNNKKPKSPKHKAGTLGTKPSDQQEQAAFLFTEILRQIYAAPTNTSTQTNRTAVAGYKQDQKKKMVEEPTNDEPTNKRKRGRPPNVSNNHTNSQQLDKAPPSECGKHQQNKQQRQPISCEPSAKRQKGRPPKMSTNRENSKLEEQLNSSKQQNKSKGGWQKGKPRNLEKRILWEQKQCNVDHGHEQEKTEEQTGETNSCEQAKKGRAGWEKGKPRNPKKRKLWEQANQQSSEATKQTTEERRTPDDLQNAKPMATEQMHEEEPMPKPAEEQMGNTDSKKTTILTGLADIMLQMTKITADIAHLMSIASEQFKSKCVLRNLNPRQPTTVVATNKIAVMARSNRPMTRTRNKILGMSIEDPTSSKDPVPKRPRGRPYKRQHRENDSFPQRSETTTPAPAKKRGNPNWTKKTDKGPQNPTHQRTWEEDTPLTKSIGPAKNRKTKQQEESQHDSRNLQHDKNKNPGKQARASSTNIPNQTLDNLIQLVEKQNEHIAQQNMLLLDQISQMSDIRKLLIGFKGFFDQATEVNIRYNRVTPADTAHGTNQPYAGPSMEQPPNNANHGIDPGLYENRFNQSFNWNVSV